MLVKKVQNEISKLVLWAAVEALFCSDARREVSLKNVYPGKASRSIDQSILTQDKVMSGTVGNILNYHGNLQFPTSVAMASS